VPAKLTVLRVRGQPAADPRAHIAARQREYMELKALEANTAALRAEAEEERRLRVVIETLLDELRRQRRSTPSITGGA